MISLPSPYDLPWPPRRVCIHWTAGGPTASQNDRKHYHYLIEQSGNVVAGFPRLASNCANLSGPSWSHDHPDGYAAHTRRFNSWSMGVSLCGMLDAEEGKEHESPYPLVPAQSDALILLLAQACEKYGLWPTEHRVMTHEEVQRLHGVDQPGKWDVRWLPITTSRGESNLVISGDAVGPYIRKRIIEVM